MNDFQRCPKLGSKTSLMWFGMYEFKTTFMINKKHLTAKQLPKKKGRGDFCLIEQKK